MKALLALCFLFLTACSSTSGFIGEDFSKPPVDLTVEDIKENYPWKGKFVLGLDMLKDIFLVETVEVIGQYDDKKYKVLDPRYLDCGRPARECWITRPKWQVRLASELQDGRVKMFFRQIFSQRSTFKQ